jgi:hypothetical protein
MSTSTFVDNAFAKGRYWTLDNLATTTTTTTTTTTANPTDNSVVTANSTDSLVVTANPTYNQATEVAQTAILQLRCDCVKLALSGKPPLNQQQQQWLGKMRQVCEFLCAAAAAAPKDNDKNKANKGLSHGELELLVGEASKAINAFSNL